MSIYKYLDISTGHVSKQTAEWMETEPEGVIMYPKGEYGWIVYVPEDPKEFSEEYSEEIPQDLTKVIDYARAKGCQWIMFDRDGESVDDLEYFNW